MSIRLSSLVAGIGIRHVCSHSLARVNHDHVTSRPPGYLFGYQVQGYIHTTSLLSTFSSTPSTYLFSYIQDAIL